MANEQIEKAKKDICRLLQKKSNTVIIDLPSEMGDKVITHLLFLLTETMGFSGVYVTTNKTSQDLIEVLKNKNISVNKLYFVDTVSEMYGLRTDEQMRCLSVSSPVNTEQIINNTFDQLSKINEEHLFILFDSLTTILLYNNMTRVKTFTEKFVSRLKEKAVSGIFISLSQGLTSKKLHDEVASLFDQQFILK